MASNLLVLCPADPFAAPPLAPLMQRLHEAGFMGVAMGQPGVHKPGDEFFEFVSFLGCSPVVSLGEPGKTAEICRIEIPAPLDAPRFFAGANLKPPRCPGCGYRTPEGRAIGEAWEHDHHAHWRCPACGREYAAPQLGWRQCAGFGRVFVKVWGVFEGEAVPSEALLRLLAEASGQPWKEFYVQL
jgi:hypothetical protein